MSASVRLVRDGPVAEVILDRPDKLNAISTGLLEDLVAVGDELRSDESCRAVVYHGAGRAFCSGIDLTDLGEGAGAMNLFDTDDYGANIAQRAVMQWRTLPVPVIAAIHGVAFGGGLQLALGADIRIVHPQARLSVMESRWGLIPDMAGTILLPPLVGYQRASELIFTARQIDGAEAVTMGLCLSADDDPVSAARALAANIAEMSPEAIREGKRLLNDTDSHATRLRAEAAAQTRLLNGDAHKRLLAEGLQARTKG